MPVVDAQQDKYADTNGNTDDPHALRASSPPSKKRRISATATRGVANLTPEQLAKKRANDREAQRAIRERTKNQIETLENRIHELVSQSPYQELRRVLHEKELVEAENQEIKRQLNTVLTILQPLAGKARRSWLATGPKQKLIEAEYNDNAQMPFSQDGLNLQSKGVLDPSTNPQERQWHQQVAPMSGERAQAVQAVPQYGVFDQERQNLSPSGDRLPVEFLLDGNPHTTKMMNGGAPVYGPPLTQNVMNGGMRSD
jgi:hypothetical protein